MQGIKLQEKHIIGLELETKTSNMNSKSSIDIGRLWEHFEKENILAKIPNKVNNELLGVYFDYDGDYTEPYSYLIGAEVTAGTEAPSGMRKIIIPESDYRKFVAKGKIPDSIAETWQLIWGTKLDRKYSYDFEIYGQKSQNWENGEVEIFIAVN